MAAEKSITEIGQIEAATDVNASMRDEMNLSARAQERASDEKEMTLLQAIKASKWAIWWSFVISLTVIMEGFGKA